MRHLKGIFSHQSSRNSAWPAKAKASASILLNIHQLRCCFDQTAIIYDVGHKSELYQLKTCKRFANLTITVDSMSIEGELFTASMILPMVPISL